MAFGSSESQVSGRLVGHLRNWQTSTRAPLDWVLGPRIACTGDTPRRRRDAQTRRAVHYLGTDLIDIEKVAAALRRQGALFLIDATQSVGVLPLDVGSSILTS